MAWDKNQIIFLSPLGGESGWQQYLPQAPSVQCQAVRRGHVWVSCYWLQWHHGAAAPCSGLPPGGAGARTRVGWLTAPGTRAPVTKEHSPPSPSTSPSSPDRGQGTEEEISWQHHWLQWELSALKCHQHTHTQPSSPQSWGVSCNWTLCVLFVYLYYCCLDANVVEMPIKGNILLTVPMIRFSLLLCYLSLCFFLLHSVDVNVTVSCNNKEKLLCCPSRSPSVAEQLERFLTVSVHSCSALIRDAEQTLSFENASFLLFYQTHAKSCSIPMLMLSKICIFHLS